MSEPRRQNQPAVRKLLDIVTERARAGHQPSGLTAKHAHSMLLAHGYSLHFVQTKRKMRHIAANHKHTSLDRIRGELALIAEPGDWCGAERGSRRVTIDE